MADKEKKVILITGGSEGLGKEIATIYALRSDIHTILISNQAENLKKTAKDLNCAGIICDVSNPDQVISSVDEVMKKYGRIDTLINNAGIWLAGGLETNSFDQIKKVIDVNTTGTIFFSRAVLPVMRKQNKGQILNVVSSAGVVAKAERSVYSASKWAITGFTNCLREEVSKYNIAVMGLYPALMKTKLFENASYDRDMTYAIDPRTVAKTVEYMLSFDDVIFPHVEVKHIKYA